MAASLSWIRQPLWVPLLMLSSLFPTSSSSSSSHHNIVLPGEGFLNPTRASSCPAPDPDLNYRPVIGILSHPGDGASGRLNNGSGVTNIPASYVKFVESAGARVVPLIHTQPWEQIQEKLELVNGVLFTGGWAKVGLYFETAQKIFQIVLDKNDAGEHFPLFGICLGFEIISMIVTKDHDICERFSAADEASTLQFTNAADIQGSLFERFPPELLRKLSTECLAMQNHQVSYIPQGRLAAATASLLAERSCCWHLGRLTEETVEVIDIKWMQENDALSSFFKILTTTVDGNDQVYVSTAQAHNYPVTCFQWHPEKNAFEWGSSKIPHSEAAIQVTQNVANYFIREARKSSNRPNAQAVRDNLIYNYSPTYGGKAGKGYDEVYIFS